MLGLGLCLGIGLGGKTTVSGRHQIRVRVRVSSRVRVAVRFGSLSGLRLRQGCVEVRINIRILHVRHPDAHIRDGQWTKFAPVH